jgi:hypothetical protein
MVEVHTCPDHPSSMEQRIADRLKPSAGDGAGDVQVTTGSTAPNRVVHTIHLSGSAGKHGKADGGGR